MIRPANGDVVTLAGLGGWPAAIPADLFLREHGGAIPAGVLQTAGPLVLALHGEALALEELAE